MDVDEPMDPVDQTKQKKKKKRPGLKLKLPDDHKAPQLSESAGVGEETKASDSMGSSTYSQIHVSQAQIDLENDLDKFAPQVKGDTIVLTKKFVEPAATLDSNADVSMTSNSL